MVKETQSAEEKAAEEAAAERAVFLAEGKEIAASDTFTDAIEMLDRLLAKYPTEQIAMPAAPARTMLIRLRNNFDQAE